MIVTSLVVACGLLIVLAAVLFVQGLALGAILGVFMAETHRKAVQAQGTRQIGAYPLPPELIRKQKDIVTKVKGLYDGKISSRQQEIIDQELEKVIVGKK